MQQPQFAGAPQGELPGLAAGQPPEATQAAAAAAADPGAETVRWTWAAYPNTPAAAAAASGEAQPGMLPLPPAIIPLACMYTPLRQPSATGAAIPVIPGRPIACRQCGALCCGRTHVDVRGKFWTCRSCLARNPLSVEQLAEGSTLHATLAATASSTVEYATGERIEGSVGPCFIFVVDTCIPPEELEALKGALLRSLDLLPSSAMVGFVSFGRSVTAWELGCSDLNKCYALRGTHTYSREELAQMLGITKHAPVLGRFFAMRDDVEFTLSSIMEELAVDPFPVPSGSRAQRVTGSAVDVAVALLSNVATKRFGKVVLFTGGPCTRGPGAVVGIDKGEMIRFHRDFLDGNTPHYAAARDFYERVQEQLIDSNSCLDVFAQSLDQVGVLEMRACVNNTGGVMVCGDTFDHAMFTESLLRYLARADLKFAPQPGDAVLPSCGFGAEISVFTSSDTLISGAVGPCRRAAREALAGDGGGVSSGAASAVASIAPLASMIGLSLNGAAASSTSASSPQASRQASPTQIGVGGTSAWRLAAVDRYLSLVFVFDTSGRSAAPASPDGSSQRFVQFVTTYIAPNGEVRVRVTSVVQPVLQNAEATTMQRDGGFDQACAAVVVSRVTVTLMEAHETKWETARRWLDRLLVKFVKKYGTFRQGDPDSLRLAPVFSLFPIFVYNLRRSEYFMILNISPDETTFKRHWLMREPCDTCLLMIQPTLDSYTLEAPDPMPVPLDASSIAPNNILLMDAFYNVHIVQGASIHEWEVQGYHNLPDYAHFRHLLEQPQAHARIKLEERFPYPRYSRTHVDGSESRHLKTRLNPSITHNTGQLQGGQKASSEVIYTDDASIARFMQTLKAAVVAPEQ